MPLDERRGEALYEILENIPIFIRKDELLVGQRASILAGRSLYPEFNLSGLDHSRTNGSIREFWAQRSLENLVRNRHPRYLERVEGESAAGFCTGTASGYGHVIANYAKVLRIGIAGIMEEARALRDTCIAGGAEYRFLSGAMRALEAVVMWATRYAELAKSLAGREKDPRRASELNEIARICEKVPANPPATFHEALQSFWFTHLTLHMEQNGWSFSAGRFDQYMYPFYLSDLSRGKERSEVHELLMSLWVKFMENTGNRLKRTVFQNLSVGGRDADGNDMSNELSVLCVDTTRLLGFNEPAITLRWHSNLAPELWQAAHRCIAAGTGMPAIFNDEVIIRAFKKSGVVPSDAVDYAIVGCVETGIPGKEQGVTSGGHLNCAKALELALNDGRSLLTGSQIGPKTGDPLNFSTFGEVIDAYRSQVHFLTDANILATRLAGTEQQLSMRYPLLSSLLEDCLASKKDLVFGSTRYNRPGIGILGPSNVYDGLLALRDLVFEQRSFTIAEIVEATRCNFRGKEALLERLRNRPGRFGNNCQDTDSFANFANDIHASYAKEFTDARGGHYGCGVWPVESHVHVGAKTGAGTDGRLSGEPLVNGVGACHGADRSGPTALLNSVAALNNCEHWPAGNTFNIRFSPSLVDGPAGHDTLKGLIWSFMEQGGQQVQINVVDNGTLRRAQRFPEQYANLLVRVAGFSAYFTMLSREVQEEIIRRNEYSG